MSEQSRRVSPGQRRLFAVLLLVSAVVLGTATIAVLALPRGDMAYYSVGSTTTITAPSIRYFPDGHFYLVRLADGRFLALHDKSSLSSQSPQADCRVRFFNDSS